MKVMYAYFHLLTCCTTIMLLAMLQFNSQSNQFKRADLDYKWGQQQDIIWPLPHTHHQRFDSNKHSTTTQKLVPCKDIRDKYLQGQINLSKTVSAEDVRNDMVLSRLKPGGRYEPSDCVDKGGTAIIIPYRDRQSHLETLINHLHAMLQRQRIKYGIFVVEMALPTQFNRGLLANAGFLTASSFEIYTCFIIHDVDLLPINDRNLYTCGDKPRHLASNVTKHTKGLPYNYYIGGVLAMTREQYQTVNGFSNLYFGWGGEDDDMYARISLSNITLVRTIPEIGTYVALHHKSDAMNPPNPHRARLLSLTASRQSTDGLNSLVHQRKALEFRPYYTWLLIECVESAYFNKFGHLVAQYNTFQTKAKGNALNTAQYKIIHPKLKQSVSHHRRITSKPTIMHSTPKPEVTRHHAIYEIIKRKQNSR